MAVKYGGFKNMAKVLTGSAEDIEKAAREANVRAPLALYCDTEEDMADEVLAVANQDRVNVVVDRTSRESLGATFAEDLSVASVAPGKQAARLGLARLAKHWRVAEVNRLRVRTTEELFAAYQNQSSATTVTTLTFERKNVEHVALPLGPLVGEPCTAASVGLHVTQVLLIAGVDPGSASEAAGLAGYLGYKLSTVGGQRVAGRGDVDKALAAAAANALSAAEGAAGEKSDVCTLGLVPTRSFRTLHVARASAAVKLGVSFTEHLAIQGIVPNTPADRAGFGAYIRKWRPIAVDGCPVADPQSLAAAVGAKTACSVTIAPVDPPGAAVSGSAPAAPPIHAPQQPAAAGKERGKKSKIRELVVARKAADESTGIYCDEKLTIEVVSPGTAGYKAGVNDLLGWRICEIDASPVTDKVTLAHHIGGKLSFTMKLSLDNEALPSNVVELTLMEEKASRELLAAFSRYGGVTQILPTEPIKEGECPGCSELIDTSSQFCSACGSPVAKDYFAKYFCHVTFNRVDDAKSAVQNPPKHLKALKRIRFYHPQQQASFNIEDPKQDETKVSPLQQANCFGFFNPWVILGVPKEATELEIKTTYKELSRRYHPDRHHDKPPEDRLACEEMFKAVAKAKNKITDAKEREALEKEIERAIAQYGKKAVMAKFPVRGDNGVVQSGEERAKEAAVNASAAAVPSVFSGYTTASLRSGAKAPAFKSYSGLKRVECVAKETDELWADDLRYASDEDDAYGRYRPPPGAGPPSHLPPSANPVANATAAIAEYLVNGYQRGYAPMPQQPPPAKRPRYAPPY
ncbi:DnaJ-like protein subfamily C member 7-like protein [Diplonema papillatum]|nr:DnaJ-like protein subfamily C member 7-like protein [Diplonema papillatum]